MAGRYNSGSSWRDNMMNTFTADGATITDGEETAVSSLMNPSWEDYRRASFTPDGLRVKGLPQKKTMPTAGADQLGKIYQYIGTTTSSFTKGYFYECILNGTTYSWQRMDVQPAGAGGEVEWGQITGTLSNQTDLQNALDAKANKNNGILTGTTSAENITVSGDLVADQVDVQTSITVPTPTDNTDATNKAYVDATDTALSARIDNLQNIGRFLAIWNAATGLPTSNPTTSPYTYKTGDYYRVGTVDDTTNYMPEGSSYTAGVASTTVYTGTDLTTGSVFYYDGSTWNIQAAGSGGTVQDVQVNGTSILSGGVANLPLYTTTGTNTDGPMTQNAVTSMVFRNGDTSKVQIGNTYATGTYSIAIGNRASAASIKATSLGNSASATGSNTVAIGSSATASQTGSIAIGANSGSNIVATGMMDIGSSSPSFGYNSSNYRLLTGLYDPQSDHDAATKGYVDAHSGSATVSNHTLFV